jgi:anti-sigma regulatory factor (Ser/Thr protein kinase)
VEVRAAPPRAVRLQAAPDSVSTARAVARDALHGWGLDHLDHTVTLLVSELCTNVLLHARTPFEVRVEHQPGWVRVTVFDGSLREANRRRYALQAGTGRGLGLVETLAADWGSCAGEGPWAKGVWFEVSDVEQDEPDAEGALYGEDWLALVDAL